MDSEVSRLVDHLFRREAGKMVATLARILGFENLQLAEDVVQDALLKAMQNWAFGAVPREMTGVSLRQEDLVQDLPDLPVVVDDQEVALGGHQRFTTGGSRDATWFRPPRLAT